jgi:LacI family transcriptional regulator
VPAAVSLVGYDDDDFAELLSPGLTTIRQDPYAIGQRAAELILGGTPPDARESVVFEPVLVVRESVRHV